MKKKSGNKSGPKPKITPELMAQVYAILAAGASLQDAAGYLEIDSSTLRRAKAANPEYARGVLRASKAGKIKLIQKIGKSNAWQAAAWMLERKYGSEYGKRDKVDVTTGGKKIGEGQFDPKRLTTEQLEAFRNLLAAGKGQGHG